MVSGPCESLDVSHASHTLRQLSHSCVSLRSDHRCYKIAQKAQLYAAAQKVQSTRAASGSKTLALCSSKVWQPYLQLTRTQGRCTRRVRPSHRLLGPETPCSRPGLSTRQKNKQSTKCSAARNKAHRSNYAAPDHRWNKPRFVHYSSRFVRHASSRWRRGWPPATSRAWRRTSRATRVRKSSY